MKLLVALVVCACAAASGKELPPSPLELTAYDYHRRFGIPRAEEIRKFEEQLQDDPGRIAGGSPAQSGQRPFHVGLIGELANRMPSESHTICGGALVGVARTLTAAHCWFDGVTQVLSFEVSMGSVLLYSGGHRMRTSAVVTHQNYSPLRALNDLCVVFHGDVPISNLAQPVALPRGSLSGESYTNNLAGFSGFGHTGTSGVIGPDQFKRFVSLVVMSNLACTRYYPLVIRSSHMCTSGDAGVGPCSGDSGGPLTVNRNGQDVLIGISSFTSSEGCDAGNPAGFTRISEFDTFLRQLGV